MKSFYRKENNVYIYNANISNSVFLVSKQEFVVDAELVDNIVSKLISACNCNSALSFKSAWQYDRLVNNVMLNIKVPDGHTARGFHKLLHKVINSKIENYDNWHDPAYAAARCLDKKIAYMTPGFNEAMNNSMSS